MRRLTRGTIREARNVLTLTRARASGGGGTTVSIPQPTAQNEIIIANATPAWSLLAAPAALGQVLITGADPYTPTWGTTFPVTMTFSLGTPANQHAVSYRPVLLENDGSASLQIISKADSADVSALVLSKAPAAGDNKHWVIAHDNDGFTIGYRTSSGVFSASGATDHLSISTAGYFKLTVVDNTALAAEFRDAGNLEYLRIVSTNAQPAVVFNEGGADVDFRVEASGKANALFVEGSTGDIGSKTNDPAADWHIVGSTVVNKHYSIYRTAILEDAEPVLQLIGLDSTTSMTHLVLTGAPTTGDNKHWIISHFGPVANNRFSIGYKTSDADNFSVANQTEHFVILTSGKIGLGTSAPSDDVHLYRTADTHHAITVDAQGTSSSQTADLNLITLGDGTKSLGNAATLGWHITARGNAYTTAAQQNDLLFYYWNGTAYGAHLWLDYAGSVSIREDSAWTRLSGTVPIQFGIGEPIVETFGQWRLPWACTVTRVDGNVIGGTSCTFNIEERDTLGSAGTNVLSSDMAADANGESVTSGFNNSALAAGNYLTIDVSAVSGPVDCLSVTLTVTID